MSYLEAIFLSSLGTFLPLIGYELDFDVTEEFFNLYLTCIEVKVSSSELCSEFFHLQLSFKAFEDANLSIANSDDEYFAADQCGRLLNYIGILDEIEEALKYAGICVKSLDDVTLQESKDLGHETSAILLDSEVFDTTALLPPSINLIDLAYFDNDKTQILLPSTMQPECHFYDKSCLFSNPDIILPPLPFCDLVSPTSLPTCTSALGASGTFPISSAVPSSTTDALSASVGGQQCCAWHTLWSLFLLWVMLYQSLLMPLVQGFVVSVVSLVPLYLLLLMPVMCPLYLPMPCCNTFSKFNAFSK